MRAGILTLLWKRRALSEVVLDYYNRIETSGVELVKVAVASPEDPGRIRSFDGWTILEAPNRPISAKWNAGCMYFRTQNVDGIIIIGSDDVLSMSYFKFIASLPGEVDYVSPTGLYLFDLRSRECIYARRIRVGAGRFVRSSLLERIGWTAWEDKTSALLDSSMDRRLMAHAKKRRSFDPREAGIVILDIKSGVNVWPYALFKRKVRTQQMLANEWKFGGREELLARLKAVEPARHD